tara:strand:- start:297 stop:455 length:159 start_codon:yes stop_codon:yes gene_type:complete
MKIINTLINLTIATALLVMLYTQYTYVKSSWCEFEIEKILFGIENIEMKLNE